MSLVNVKYPISRIKGSKSVSKRVLMGSAMFLKIRKNTTEIMKSGTLKTNCMTGLTPIDDEALLPLVAK